MDVDLPTSDLDPLDEKAHESLALGEVELIDGGRNPLGEALDPVTQAVVGGELVALGDQLVTLVSQTLVTFIDVVGPPRELGRVEHAGLVEVGDAPAFRPGRLDAPVETAQLAGEQLVVGARAAGGHGCLAGE
ncbi:MAG: hypothetical protein LC749_16715 [Actinobacteria bacterium]|nr:hypothetical protein [Actinomycetota bacterium]